ncbi:Metallophosphoesterase [uncultured delta proteobacterium]|uniref:Metallophosphoesterase n=1 Tax=uncultured delta proteobacterium TaxID=34034 RepID=A0A212JTK2_9DELT|nr:Metallophosphoesterase [uncultured delta proteobacterium]
MDTRIARALYRKKSAVQRAGEGERTPGGTPLVIPFPKCYTLSMPRFTFIHAADLHLGAPFRGLDGAASAAFPSSGPSSSPLSSPSSSPSSRKKGNFLAEASFIALDRLEKACLDQGAAFLILSGDIYDDKDGVLRARFALRDMFLRLKDADVRVFIAHGNHDPLRPGPLPVAWPDNVTVFGPEVSRECVMQDGVPLALVQGISHTAARETENLALRFTRYAPGKEDGNALSGSLPEGLPADIFQIAVLHCAVGGAADGHAPYAPCALSDLTGAGFDYWALGHVHQGGIVCDAPYVVYPGSIQGLHINETGAHGCAVVRVDGRSCAVEQLPLAPVVWEKMVFTVTEGTATPVATIDALEEALLEALQTRAGERNGAEAVFCRVILEGATELDAELRRPGSLETLLERLRKELAAHDGPARVWLKDIRLATSPDRDFAALAGRDDLVGEVVRLASAMRDDPARAEEVADRALSALRGNAKLKKILALGGEAHGIGGMDGAVDTALSAPDLADEAKALLCSLLEGDE